MLERNNNISLIMTTKENAPTKFVFKLLKQHGNDSSSNRILIKSVALKMAAYLHKLCM